MRNKKEKVPTVLDLEIFEHFMNSLNMSIDSALKTADTQKKEVVLSIKVNIDTCQRVDNDKMIQWTEPHVDYKLTRTIKESKFDYAGKIEKAAMKIVDGKVFIVSMEKDEGMQLDLFDSIDEVYDV